MMIVAIEDIHDMSRLIVIITAVELNDINFAETSPRKARFKA